MTNESGYAHQDWVDIVIHKKFTDEKSKAAVTWARREGKAIETLSRQIAPKGGQKLEKDLYTDPTEEAPKLKPLPKLSQTDRQAMIQARIAKKWSQTDLARHTNLRSQIIQDIENGKIIENLQSLQLINRILGTKLKAMK